MNNKKLECAINFTSSSVEAVGAGAQQTTENIKAIDNEPTLSPKEKKHLMAGECCRGVGLLNG